MLSSNMRSLILKERPKKLNVSLDRARQEGQIPVVCYSKNYNKSFLLDEKFLKEINENNPYAEVFIINSEGEEKFYAILKNVQIHPVTGKIIHADFYRIQTEDEVIIPAKINVINKDKSPGLKMKGILFVQQRYVGLKYKIQEDIKIRTSVDCDIQHMEKKQKLYARDLKIDNLCLSDNTVILSILDK